MNPLWGEYLVEQTEPVHKRIPLPMRDRNRLKLLFGPYRPPRCRVGGRLTCAIRGKVKVVGMSDAPIQWPQTKRRDGSGRPYLIVAGDLVKAIRRESEIAVAYWWGVSPLTVWTWRKALGVPVTTEGTSRLRSAWSPWSVQSNLANRRRAKAYRSPERSAKIAAARRGKPRPPHVVAILRRCNQERVFSPVYRAKLSAANKRRGAWPPAAKGPPWTSEEEAMLGTMPDGELAKKIGRTESAVKQRRCLRGILLSKVGRPPKRPSQSLPRP